MLVCISGKKGCRRVSTTYTHRKNWMRKVWICCWVGQVAVSAGKAEVPVPCALQFSSVRSHKSLYLVKEFREGGNLSWAKECHGFLESSASPGRLCHLQPLRFSWPNWIKTWANWSNGWLCFQQEAEPDLWRLLLAWTKSMVPNNVYCEGCPQPFSSLFEFWNVCCNSVCRR